MGDSKQLEQLFEDACRAVSDGDAAFFDQHLDEEVLAIGSAPEEIYRGKRELLNGLRQYGAIPTAARTTIAGSVTPAGGALATSRLLALTLGCRSSLGSAAKTAGRSCTGTYRLLYPTNRCFLSEPSLAALPATSRTPLLAEIRDGW
jgi:hypothetical protein